MQRNSDAVTGDDDEEGIEFGAQQRLQEIKMYQHPDEYTGVLNQDRIKQFLERKFQGRELQALKSYFIDKKPIAFSVLPAGMDTETFQKLRQRAQEMAKKEGLTLVK